VQNGNETFGGFGGRETGDIEGVHGGKRPEFSASTRARHKKKNSGEPSEEFVWL
jgi:hypothetical protein